MNYLSPQLLTLRFYLILLLSSFIIGCGGSGGIPLPGSGGLPDPVTVALTGSHATYNVGTGQAYAEPDSVPWGALVAGDVVNIYYRATPYKWKIGLRGQGTAEKPIIINGVTNDKGQRPQFDFNGARTASGSNPGNGNNVFYSTPENGESLGGIVIKRGLEDRWGSYSPRWIQIKNLELFGAADGNSYTTLAGNNVVYSGAAGMYVHLGDDILLENLVIRDNANGIFTMAKDGLFSEACKRITVRNSRIYGNGVVNSYLRHNLYVQAHMPVIEGNYIGQVRAGSEGSSYKSRSSGEVFRYNYVLASARAMDWVYSEDQDTDGISQQPEYGTDYAYGNIIISDANLPNYATSPIHYGGDNLDEQEPGKPILINPEYRKHLYFWNNTVVFRVDQDQSWRANVFDLSLVDTTVDAWNNVFVLDSATPDSTPSQFSWVQNAGVVNLSGTNLAFGTIRDSDERAESTMYQVNKANGTLVTGDPQFVNMATQDYRLKSGSAAIDRAGGLPAGLPSSLATTYPLEGQARVGANVGVGFLANGWVPRVQQANAMDLGAIEYAP